MYSSVARSHVRLIKRSSQSQLREDRPASLHQFGRFLTFYEEKYGLEPGLDPNNRVRQPQMSRLLNMTSYLVSHYVSREFDHCTVHICKNNSYFYLRIDLYLPKLDFKYLQLHLNAKQFIQYPGTEVHLSLNFEAVVHLCNCYELHCYRHHITEERAGISLWSSVCVCRGLVKVNLDPGFRLGHIPPQPPLSTCLTTRWTDVHTRASF